MRAELRKAGPKPANAFRLQEAAKLNIVIKRDFLVSISQKVSHFKLQTQEKIDEWNEFVATVPRSRTQFNGWASNTVPRTFLQDSRPFGSNGNDTLKKTGLLESVELAISGLQMTLKKPDRNHVRGQTIAALERQVKLNQRVRLIAEGELIRVKRELERMSDVCEDLRRRLTSAEREGRLASQRSGIPAELPVKPGKVVSLRPNQIQSVVPVKGQE